MTILPINFERIAKKKGVKKTPSISVFSSIFRQENAAQDGADPAGDYRPRVWKARQKSEGYRGGNSGAKIRKKNRFVQNFLWIFMISLKTQF